MKYFCKIIYFLYLVFTFSISSSYLYAQNIKVYGLSTCSYCIHFLEELKTLDEPYIFYDLLDDDKRTEEMRKLARKIDPEIGSVDLPLVVYKNNIWIRPSFSEFASKLTFPSLYKNFSNKHKILLYASSSSSEVVELRMHYDLRKIRYEFKDINLRDTEEELQKNIQKNKINESLVYPILSIDGKLYTGINFLNSKKLFKK